MINAKSSSVPLATHFQLSKDQFPKSDSEKKLMEKVPYSNAIGSIMYLMVCTRPDIAYAVSCLNRYMSNAGPPHWEALKWLLRYLSGSANTGIKFSRSSKGINLVGYVDSNYANDGDSRKSTTSYIFTLCGSCISWKSQLQNIVALSTTEVEYIATTEAFKEAMWLEGPRHGPSTRTTHPAQRPKPTKMTHDPNQSSPSFSTDGFSMAISFYSSTISEPLLYSQTLPFVTPRLAYKWGSFLPTREKKPSSLSSSNNPQWTVLGGSWWRRSLGVVLGVLVAVVV
ncbi:UNVERIFIED_CONTAM: Retrovirus-related Pol polyprotein from transposon TNT 1-94 [Sesamum radiatum]|uniref:Retrovirus-related Pol polyprotein from transposon TNT 1-94 n=1 Tax=Sesamum radiatum TaxID=300843 RepID=A0AAW2RWP6_SESRA